MIGRYGRAQAPFKNDDSFKRGQLTRVQSRRVLCKSFKLYPSQRKLAQHWLEAWAESRQVNVLPHQTPFIRCWNSSLPRIVQVLLRILRPTWNGSDTPDSCMAIPLNESISPDTKARMNRAWADIFFLIEYPLSQATSLASKSNKPRLQ